MPCRATPTETALLASRPNVTSNVVFFKLHKVGGTTFASSLWRALHSRGHVLANRSQQPVATACLDHQGGDASGKVLAVLVTFRRLLGASQRTRACMINQHGLATHHGACRLAVGLPTHTAIVLRHPVERIISKYYFQKRTCPKWKVRKLRGDGVQCAATVLPLLTWLNGSSTWVEPSGNAVAPWRAARGASPGGRADSHWQIPCEQLWRLGGDCSLRALTAAKHTLDAIDVVGVTEHMRATLALAEGVLGLDVGSARPTQRELANADKREVSPAVRRAIARLPVVQLEARLYAHALQRFVGLLESTGLTHELDGGGDEFV